MRRQGQVAVLPHAGNPCWMCETTLRPQHHSLPSVAGRRGKPSVPRTDRHEVLHIMAPDNARKPCAGTALRGHEMHTVPIRRDHGHGGPLGTIRLATGRSASTSTASAARRYPPGTSRVSQSRKVGQQPEPVVIWIKRPRVIRRQRPLQVRDRVELGVTETSLVALKCSSGAFVW